MNIFQLHLHSGEKGCTSEEKKIAHVDCQKSLLYCKKKKNKEKKRKKLIAFTDDKCGILWQTRGKDSAMYLLFKNPSHSV